MRRRPQQNRPKVPGDVVGIDQIKALDSVLHDHVLWRIQIRVINDRYYSLPETNYILLKTQMEVTESQRDPFWPNKQ